MNIRSAILPLISIFIFSITACEIPDEILNGVVSIEHKKAPQAQAVSALMDTTTDIEIFFSSKNPIEEVYVDLFVEDASLFELENGTVELKEEFCLNAFPDDSKAKIIDFEALAVGQNSFTFKQSVDLSSYPDGTCFVLFGTALGNSELSEGYDSRGIYFCKGNAN
ncbi:MAG: hypothetical protein AAF696_13390 [Bacteroidota bacterium]